MDNLSISLSRRLVLSLGVGALVFIVVFAILIPHLAPRPPLSSEPLVVLRTGYGGGDKVQTGPNTFIVSCPTDYVSGELLPDPVAGIVIMSSLGGGPAGRIPVIWPSGYTGRRTPDGQIDVVDKSGRLMVTTGTQVQLWGGYGGKNSDGSISWQACDGGINAAQ